MSLERIAGGLSEDRLEVCLTESQDAQLQTELRELACRIGGHAWLIQVDGVLLGKGGDPPSELTFEMRKQAFESGAALESVEGVVGREARPGRTLRTIPQTVSAFVRPLGVLIGMPGTDSTFSDVLGDMSSSQVRIQRMILDALWVVPPPIRISFPHPTGADYP